MDAWWEIQTFGSLKLPRRRRFWTRRVWWIIEESVPDDPEQPVEWNVL